VLETDTKHVAHSQIQEVFMDIRYSANQRDVKRYTTQELRDEFLITGLYKPDEVVAVYSHVDRMVTFGCMPVHEVVSLDKGIDCWANFGTHYILERREIGIFNIGDGAGKIVVDGTEYKLGYKDCLYITKGAKEVLFSSDDAEKPAKFYMVSAPAHVSYETKLITMAEANHRPCGEPELANARVINQFIHPDVLKTAQLSMGMTELQPGSVWNTMPSHTHERRMEIYTYFEVPEDQVVFHLMGEPTETRHIVMHNYDAVISPSWSIHSAAGTHNYTFIWAMGGENQEFDDMDTIYTPDLR
jgi:4-deoxy-L-threo-5-hexosulose-uronate ketol-isomerase